MLALFLQIGPFDLIFYLKFLQIGPTNFLFGALRALMNTPSDAEKNSVQETEIIKKSILQIGPFDFRVTI